MKIPLQAKTLGELKTAKYKTLPVRDEMRNNLISMLKEGKPRFENIIGYEYTVLPALEKAILARHSINLLGLRGQAKTRIARMMVRFLDEYTPVIAGSEVNDDPFSPVSYYGKKLLKEKGDDTPIEWVHRDDRYTEKLATPDVTVADLIGDVDPIKAANLKLEYSDERVIHFGLLPRSNRGIFVINELPDLQPRIQVALFNILQEKDMQIRGFKLRLPMDIQFVFTANPEDYTNRGSIITPLKDRIQSQIMTHYPKSLEISKQITQQEVKLGEEQRKSVKVPDLIRDLVEQLVFEARESEYVDEKSGVSARLPISAYECVVSSAERRRLLNNESQTVARISDFSAAVPAIVGKIEMVYEGEQEGAVNVSHKLLSSAIRTIAKRFFPEISEVKSSRKEERLKNRYSDIIDWFRQDNKVDLLNECSDKNYRKTLESIPLLKKTIAGQFSVYSAEEQYLLMEFLLHALAEYSLLDKKILEVSYHFQDLFSSYFPLEN